MKLFNRNILALLASVSLLTSCSDDVLLRDKDNDGSENGIVFYVPNVPEGADPAPRTRAIGNVNDFNGNEAEIKNLRIFAYKDGAENPITIDLKNDGTLISSDVDGYDGYRIRADLENGDYEMYAVANSAIADNTTRTKLLEATATVPDDLAVSGIPMSCSNEKMEVAYSGNAFQAVGSNRKISVNSGANIRIKANLRFAVAKVRLTLINDLRPSDMMGAVTVTNHAASSSLIEGGTVPAGKGSSQITGKYYQLNKPSTGTLLDMNIDRKNLTEFTPANNGSTPWIWQTVFYVPERLAQTATDYTAVTMKVGDENKEIRLGHDEGSKGRIVERSNFYDFVGTSDGKFQLDVQPWTPAVLAGSLDGNYWLKVDKTAITITAGEKTEIRYESNTDVIPSCEKYNGQDIYSFSKENGVLTITINSEIDREEFDAIKATDNWEYITLTAGTIKKKIDITEFTYSEYIMENTVVTIDVNERKQSGEYRGYIPVKLTTNLKYISFTKSNWPAEAEEGTPASLILQDKNGNAITPGAKIEVPETGEIEFRIAYNDLNGNRKLWQKDKDMQVLVNGLDKDGNAISNNGVAVQCSVGVYVRTSYDVYRIHLYAPGWNHPHIFVYQCLQLPADVNYTNGAKKSQVVGHDKDNTAFEYDFTGAVAFKGWYVGSFNNPNAPGSTDNYFWLFNDGTSWNPTRSSNVKDYDKHYYTMDFAKDHRDQIRTLNNGRSYCTVCTGTDFPSNWPGIHMRPDEDKPANSGWWYFELSGVADPGKALVMFTDCGDNNHDWGSWMEAVRYPKEKQPGVALFDYPTKEGWFVYTNAVSTGLSFISEDPGVKPNIVTPNNPTTTTTFEVGKTYALVFNGSAQIWAWAEGDSYSENKGQSWDSQPIYNGVFEFTPTKAGNTSMTYKVNKGDAETTLPVGEFKWNASTSRYEKTINI